MTTRSFPDSLQTSWAVLERPPVAAPYYLSGPFVNSISWINTVTHGENVPGWREKLRDGIDATTTLTGSRVETKYTPGFALYTYLWGGQVWRDELTGSHNIDVSVPGNDLSDISSAKATAEAVGRFNQSIRNVHTSLEGGVFVGELAQTLRMIRNPAQGIRRLADEFGDIARAIRRMPHRGGNRIKNVTEALADAWLEAQFGWRPFLNDVKDGAQALSEISKRRDNGTRRVTGKYTSPEYASLATPSGNLAGVVKWRTLSRTTGHCMVIIRGAVRVEAKDPLVIEPAVLGFDPASWIPTIWELIPYSFLIDYFTNIGDVIRGWSQLGVDLAWSNMTVRKHYEKTAWSEDFPPATAGVTSVAFAKAEFVCTKRSVSRLTYSGTTVPDFTFRVPGFGSQRWLNIAALIASRNADRKWVYD